MRAAGNLFVAAVILAAGLLATGFGLAQQWLLTILAALAGIAWLLGGLRRWAWLANLALAVLISLAALGCTEDMLPVVMIAGASASLAAWDLNHLYWRMRKYGKSAAIGMETAHVVRLLSVCLAGFICAALGLWIRLKIGFVVILILALVMILSFNRLADLLRRPRE